jgi:ribosomal protein S18 acetylase RimI-like enzyme
MDILVREFEEADRDALRLLYIASRNAAFTWSAVELHQALDFDAHTEGEKILVAVTGAEILGFASIWEPDSFLHNLFVHPSATRQGVGQALLASCAKYFSNTPTLKCLKATLTQRSSTNPKAGKLSEKRSGQMGHTSSWQRPLQWDTQPLELRSIQ